MDLSVGNVVVHSRYGAGKVVGEQTLERNGKPCRYFSIELVHQRGTLLFPAETADENALRPAIRDFVDIVAVLNETPSKLPDDHRTRQNDIERLLNSGTPQRIVQVLRDLTWRETSIRLTGTDSRQKATAFKSLIDELTLSSLWTSGEAESALGAFLEQAMNRQRDTNA